MGVNLVTRVRNFYIQDKTFTAFDGDVEDGCVTPGAHKLLRFDFLSYNAGDADMVIGSPAARPDLFVWSAGHGHFHMRDFNEFLLFDSSGNLATIGYKQAFCAIDLERIAPDASATARFTSCNDDQGISAGWADVYSSTLDCQFIVIDGVPDGDYTLQSTTNAQHAAAEDCYGDNTAWTGLRITGNIVAVIDPPWIPEDRIPFNRSNVSATLVSGRWKVVENGHWMLDTGTSQSEAQRAVEIIQHYGLSQMCFVGRPRCGDVDPMMYWLTDAGQAPSGELPGEDCIPFNPSNLAVVEIGGRWKVVEGTHWILDFGPGEGNAVAALHFIRKYGFDQICFVGRPHPSMTYFKKAAGRGFVVEFVDPRMIDLTIDPPSWWREQAKLVGEQAPAINFSALCPGSGPNPEDISGTKIEVYGNDGKTLATTDIVTRHGLTGLDVRAKAEIRFPRPASVVDVVLAHFGDPPNVRAWAGKYEAAEAVASPLQRQAGTIRLLGAAIDRVTINCGKGGALLTHVRWEPAKPEDGDDVC